MYPRMVEIVQHLGSSSLMARPTEADFTSPIAPILGAKRGPKTVVSDSEIVTAIRTVLAATPSHGEGYWRFARGSPIAGSRSAASARSIRRTEHLFPVRRGDGGRFRGGVS